MDNPISLVCMGFAYLCWYLIRAIKEHHRNCSRCEPGIRWWQSCAEACRNRALWRHCARGVVYSLGALVGIELSGERFEDREVTATVQRNDGDDNA